VVPLKKLSETIVDRPHDAEPNENINPEHLKGPNLLKFGLETARVSPGL